MNFEDFLKYFSILGGKRKKAELLFQKIVSSQEKDILDVTLV